jgi:hypothetical protein
MAYDDLETSEHISYQVSARQVDAVGSVSLVQLHRRLPVALIGNHIRAAVADSGANHLCARGRSTARRAARSSEDSTRDDGEQPWAVYNLLTVGDTDAAWQNWTPLDRDRRRVGSRNRTDTPLSCAVPLLPWARRTTLASGRRSNKPVDLIGDLRAGGVGRRVTARPADRPVVGVHGIGRSVLLLCCRC